MAAEFFKGSSSLDIKLELQGGYYYSDRSWNTSLQDLMNWWIKIAILEIDAKTRILKWFVVCCGFSTWEEHLELSTFLSPFPDPCEARKPWVCWSISMFFGSPWSTFIEKACILAGSYKVFKKPEPLNNLGEKYEDLELSEPLANAHAGALPEREAHKRMNCLLWEKIHELLSKAHDTYIFFLGFHPSFW